MVLLIGGVGQTQPISYPAILEVTYEGLEVKRRDTRLWIDVAPNAVMPIGEGDRLRTQDTGRAFIHLTNDQASTLILPNSEIEIRTITAKSVTITLHAGEVIASVNNPTLDYTLDGQHWSIAAQMGLLLASHRANTDVFVIAEGDHIAHRLQNTESQHLSQQTALYAPHQMFTIRENLSFPTSPAQVVGLLEGCPGVVQTASARNLNARIGPGTGNPRLGQFPDNANVRIMGLVASGGWYRVQFRSGFGWVERFALTITDSDCDLPTLPDTSFDLPSRIFDVTPAEITLLEPFYGTPDDDPIFYQ